MRQQCMQQVCKHCKLAALAALHVGMTTKQHVGLTQWTQFHHSNSRYHSLTRLLAKVYDEHLQISLEECQD